MNTDTVPSITLGYSVCAELGEYMPSQASSPCPVCNKRCLVIFTYPPALGYPDPGQISKVQFHCDCGYASWSHDVLLRSDSPPEGGPDPEYEPEVFLTDEEIETRLNSYAVAAGIRPGKLTGDQWVSGVVCFDLFYRHEMTSWSFQGAHSDPPVMDSHQQFYMDDFFQDIYIDTWEDIEEGFKSIASGFRALNTVLQKVLLPVPDPHVVVSEE